VDEPQPDGAGADDAPAHHDAVDRRRGLRAAGGQQHPGARGRAVVAALVDLDGAAQVAAERHRRLARGGRGEGDEEDDQEGEEAGGTHGRQTAAAP
jgi:hypothetical protein